MNFRIGNRLFSKIMYFLEEVVKVYLLLLQIEILLSRKIFVKYWMLGCCGDMGERVIGSVMNFRIGKGYFRK